MSQSSEKLGAPSARASLFLPACSLPGPLLLPAKSQVGSQEKSEPAEAAWDSSVDPRLGQAHWAFNNAIKPQLLKHTKAFGKQEIKGTLFCSRWEQYTSKGVPTDTGPSVVAVAGPCPPHLAAG